MQCLLLQIADCARAGLIGFCGKSPLEYSGYVAVHSGGTAMTGERTKRDFRYRDRVSAGEEHEVRYCAKHYRVHS